MESPATPPSPIVVLDGDSLNQLNTPDAKALLDTIDSLREIHVGDIVNLPQIIVVGDQSSGKSSVLEAISGVQFPVDGDLCTRFATELILRRAPETTVHVSIQLADDHTPPAARGDALRQPFQRSSFNKRDLPDIIREAKERMNIGEGGARKFSSDVLRIEISAPDVYSLTLVDLPGIFHSATADQNIEGKAIVEQLIDGYMRQPKSIILAVVAANNQLANQLVLEKTQIHDRSRARTIGVITKPDLADPGSANERKYLDLAKGRESMHKLALGWYVLRNRSEAERASEDAGERDAVEDRFFRVGAWSAVSSANRGVESLRKKLSKVLLDHIKISLPTLIEDIMANLRARQEELDRLGKSRSTPDELRLYLLHIAEEYQRLARDAVGGRYNDKFFGGIEAEPMKLRARLRSLNRAFGFIMANRSGRYRIVPDASDSDAGSDGNGEEEECPEYLREVVEAYGVPKPEVKANSEVVAELQHLASLNQGMEFPGEANSDLARQLFKDQATPWHGIAWRHIELVLAASQEFAEGAFYHITGVDDSTSGAIVNDCVEPFFEAKREKLRDKLEELLHPYANGCGIPHEDDFREIMSGIRLRRLARRIEERLDNRPEGAQRLDIEDILRDLDIAEVDSFGSAKVLEMMEAFYDVSQPNYRRRGGEGIVLI
jgi:GTPase SAR1 family protein